MSSIPAFNTENIEKALHQLYYDPSIELKDVAQQWLTKAQRSNEAWHFSWELLQENKATEVQYFGASSLISKISGSWADIPNTEIMVLRNRLFEQIVKFSMFPEKKIVITRLCVAFSVFLSNCAVKQLWPTAIEDIIQKFQDKQTNISNDEYYCYALLEILTIVAEEFQTCNIEKYKKGLFLHMLKSGQTKVLNLLIEIFRGSSEKLVQKRVIKCLSSWIILGLPLSDSSKLLFSIFESTKDPELFEESVECLLNTFSAPSSQDYPSTIKKFIPLVVSLQPVFQKAVDDRDAETILGLTKMICSLAENFPKLIIETLSDPNNGLGMINLVLQCCRVPLQYPTEECASPISFTFWCSLQDEIESLPDSTRGLACQHLRPYFFQLVDCLLTKACYPKDDSFNDWNAEEKEQHRIYRVDVSDTLMYVLNMFGVDIFLHIFNKLQISIHEASSDPNKLWHDVEVCLFGIHSVIESLMEYTTDVPGVQTLVEVLPTIHVSSLQLADTLLYTIGTLTEWLNVNPGKLLPLMAFVLKCLGNPDLALAAVLTVRRLVRECCDELVSCAGDIMQHFTNLLTSGALQKNVEVWLMQAAGHMLSAVPREPCLKYLESLLNLQLHQLEALSKDCSSSPNKTTIIHILDLLANLFYTLDRRKENEDGELISEKEEQPAVMILVQLNSIIQNILNTWISDKEIVESICQMYDKSIRSLVADFAPVLIQLCTILCGVCRTYPYACILNLSQQVLLVFGSDEVFRTTISSFFHSLLLTMMPLFQSNDIKNHLDTAQEFMRLLAGTCRKHFNLLKFEMENHNRTVLSDLFKCGMITLQQPENESVITSASFLVEFVCNYNREKEVAAVVDVCAKELLLITLQAIGGASPRTNMDKFADILSAIGQANFILFNKSMNELINLPSVPNDNVDATKKKTFVKFLLKEVKRKQKFRELVKEFTLVCRGIQGTEYAGK